MQSKHSNSYDLKTKRQQILDAAYQVFSRKGYYRATVDEIISLADTGKGTVYNYFTNKEQLFYTIIKEKSEPFHKDLKQIETANKPCMEKVALMIKSFLRFYVENGDLWRVLMHEIRGVGPKGQSGFTESQLEKYREGFQVTIGMIENVLTEGINQGVIKQCDAKKAAYGLFSVIVMMVFQNFVKEDLDDTAAMIADIFLYGVAKEC